MGNFSFGKEARLLNSKNFKAVFDKAEFKVSNKELLILANQNGFSFSRLGLVIAKKNVRLAVQRNRIKRVIRESFRIRQKPHKGLDIVVLARRGLDCHQNHVIHLHMDNLWLKLQKRANK